MEAFFRSLFSPAVDAVIYLFLSSTPRSFRPQAARGASQRNDLECPETAGVKPRPSTPWWEIRVSSQNRLPALMPDPGARRG